jgi:hypothetical protein
MQNLIIRHDTEGFLRQYKVLSKITTRPIYIEVIFMLTIGIFFLVDGITTPYGTIIDSAGKKIYYPLGFSTCLGSVLSVLSLWKFFKVQNWKKKSISEAHNRLRRADSVETLNSSTEVDTDFILYKDFETEYKKAWTAFASYRIIDQSIVFYNRFQQPYSLIIDTKELSEENKNILLQLIKGKGLLRKK